MFIKYEVLHDNKFNLKDKNKYMNINEHEGHQILVQSYSEMNQVHQQMRSHHF